MSETLSQEALALLSAEPETWSVHLVNNSGFSLSLPVIISPIGASAGWSTGLIDNANGKLELVKVPDVL